MRFKWAAGELVSERVNERANEREVGHLILLAHSQIG